MDIFFNSTVRHTIGAAAAPNAISVLAEISGTLQGTGNAPNVNFTAGNFGPTAIVAGQTIASAISTRVATDPGQLDTLGSILVTITPVIGAAQTRSWPLWFRAADYEISGPAVGTWPLRAFADRWIKAHPGGSLGLLQAQVKPILVQFAGAQPSSNDTSGMLLRPGDPVLTLPATAPACWIRGASLWPGQPDQYSPGGLFEVNPAVGVVSR